MERVQVKFNKIMQSKAYTCLVFGTESKQFAIYTEPSVGKNLQMLLAEEPHPRPYTHDLMNLAYKGLDVKVLQILINRLEDSTYFARLFLQKQEGEMLHILEIDARPSDCITLALSHNAPIYCNKDILLQAVPFED